MHKLNIFWIEDNPIMENTDDIDGIPVPSFDIEAEAENDLLSFKIFQHPMEVFEYLSMINQLNESGLSSKLAEICPEALPDIVVFDYKLSDNFSTYNPAALQYTDPVQYQFLRDHSVSLKLKSAFDVPFRNKELFIERQDVTNGDYSSDEFKNALCAKKITNIDDDFGLFSGIAIIREFKNLFTLGVPATLNKRSKSALSENSLYYEWLNSYDLKDAIERPDKDGKQWRDILLFALPILRNRIKMLVRAGKVIIGLDQLLKMTANDHPISDRLKEFTFISAYGERSLSLDALFIDCPNGERSKKIADWADEVLEILFKQKEYTLSTALLDNAFQFSDELWSNYKNVELMLKRLRVSELGHLRSLKDDDLSKEIGKDQDIDDIRAKYNEEFIVLSNEFGIKNNKLEYGYDLRSGKFSCLERRWGIFITMLRLHHHFLEYTKRPDERLSGYSNLRIEPQEDDYYLALFPIATTPIVTRIHKKNDGDNFKTALRRQSSLTGDLTRGDKGLQMDSILNCINDDNGILASEKYLIKSIAKNTMLFPLYTDSSKMPIWSR